MSTYTPNLNLLKKNPLTEGSDVFNIETMMNDNWDKIDSFSALLEASIAPLYSTSSAYAVGAWCTHDGKLYQCTTAIGSGGEAWNASHWTAKSTTELIAAVKAAIPSAYTSNPAMNGTASPGNSTSWSRGNHVHPTDTSRAAQTALDTYVRPNMLDNWDWRSPINSRGLTTYTGVSNYSINRWYIANNTITVSVETGGLKFTGSASMPSGYRLFEQIMNWYYNSGTKVTISARVISCSGTFRIMFGSGSVSSNRLNSPDFSGPGVVTVTGTINASVDKPVFALVSRSTGASSVKIDTVKVEIGDTQTLTRTENGSAVLNEAPVVAEQLLRASLGQQVDGTNDIGTALPLYRQEAFFSSDTTPTIEGAINWTYS